MQPTILLVRHGNTTFDKKVDAFLDPPLDHGGIEKMKRTGEFLRDKYKFTKIISSPLQRAVKSAELIGEGNVKIYPNRGASPWNLGDMQGKFSKEVHDQIEYYMDYPDLKVPRGESYRTYWNRWSDLLLRIMNFAEQEYDEAIVVTTHSRNVNSLQEIIGGNPIGDVVQATPEASVTLLAKNGVGSDWEYRIIWEGR